MTAQNKTRIIEVADIGRLADGQQEEKQKEQAEPKPGGEEGLTEGVDTLSTTGKIFFAAVAAYLAGKLGAGTFLKLRGSPEELRTVADALAASKAFQDELRKPGANIDGVISKMNLKNITAARFKTLTGKSFPL